MPVGMIDTQAIRQRWESVGSKLDERGRRVFAAGEVRAAGWGGLEAVSAITGLARSTIGRGLKDLDAAPPPKGRERRKGGGRRHLSSRDATLEHLMLAMTEDPDALVLLHACAVNVGGLHRNLVNYVDNDLSNLVLPRARFRLTNAV